MELVVLIYGLLAIPALIALTLIGLPGQWASDQGHHLVNDIVIVILILTVLYLIAYLL